MYVGIDLGGTNIAVGAVSDEGKLLKKASLPTLAGRSYKEIAADMADLCRQVTDGIGGIEAVKAIGIGSPGAVDSENGVVVFAGNLSLNNAPLAAEVKKYFNIPVHMENDANAAAYGEYIACNVDADSFVFVTLGTGVGGGIIINKKIYSGFNGIGAEIGHMTLEMNGKECNCGNRGCYEKYASVTALIEQTKQAIEKNPASVMSDWVQENGHVSGRTAFECALNGDSAAVEVRDTYIRYVAEGIVSVVNIFQPELVVIGGGISKEGDILLNPIKEFVAKREFNKHMKKTDIQIARLFNDAGIIGAAMAAKANLE